jgi:hypothetical protein
MKKELAVFALTIGLTSTAPAFAGGDKMTAKGEKIGTKTEPVKMTDQQLDEVTAGALVNVIAFDVVDIRHVVEDVNVAAQAQVGILSAQAASGRIVQQ